MTVKDEVFARLIPLLDRLLRTSDPEAASVLEERRRVYDLLESSTFAGKVSTPSPAPAGESAADSAARLEREDKSRPLIIALSPRAKDAYLSKQWKKIDNASLDDLIEDASKDFSSEQEPAS